LINTETDSTYRLTQESLSDNLAGEHKAARYHAIVARVEVISVETKKLEAASGFEPLHRGFADLSLSHLGTPPR
jgi:hypothetical protein